jgi:hypothetical protein
LRRLDGHVAARNVTPRRLPHPDPGLMVYRIGSDGRLVRKYDVDMSAGQQFWSGMARIG